MTRAQRLPMLAALVAALVGTLLVATPGAGVAGPTATGDVYIRDDVNDTGAEPNPWSDVWNSPDIQVVQVMGTTVITVRLNNAGDPITGNLQLFYTRQGTAAKWWNDWSPITVFSNVTVPTGGATLQVLWSAPDAGHFCLLARWESQQDPVTSPEFYGSSTYPNVQKNNNLAWKNFDVVKFKLRVWYQHPIRLRNPDPGPRPYHLVLAQQPDRPFTRTGRLVLDLGPVLAARWRQSGQQGVGVRQVGATQVEVVNTGRAVIQNLMMYPDEQLDVNLGFLANTAAVGDQYPVSVIQTDTQGRNVGGLDLTAVVE